MNSRLTYLTLVPFLVIACGGDPNEAETQTEQTVAAKPSTDRAPSDGRCWSDRDCGAGQICEGERICPPGGLCGPLADQPGKCVAAGCDFEGRHYPPGAVFGACDACTCLSDGTVACQDFACIACITDDDCPDGYACTSLCPPGAICRPVAREAYCMPK